MSGRGTPEHRFACGGCGIQVAAQEPEPKLCVSCCRKELIATRAREAALAEDLADLLDRVGAPEHDPAFRALARSRGEAGDE